MKRIAIKFFAITALCSMVFCFGYIKNSHQALAAQGTVNTRDTVETVGNVFTVKVPAGWRVQEKNNERIVLRPKQGGLVFVTAKSNPGLDLDKAANLVLKNHKRPQNLAKMNAPNGVCAAFGDTYDNGEIWAFFVYYFNPYIIKVGMIDVSDKKVNEVIASVRPARK